MKLVRLGWAREYEVWEKDGKCFARARFGKHDVVEADSPGELLIKLRFHYPGTFKESCST